jgi:hypothetical protein
MDDAGKDNINSDADPKLFTKTELPQLENWHTRESNGGCRGIADLKRISK